MMLYALILPTLSGINGGQWEWTFLIRNGIKELSDAIKNDPQRLLLGSAHPQGGNRMGKDPDTCVVDSSGKVYWWKNLFICDTSVLPTAVGVNPQLTVMSLATIIANRINNSWSEFASVEAEDKKNEGNSKKKSRHFSVIKVILVLASDFYYSYSVHFL
jgi:choline dehydrogenase-like flavoprotein